jgi:hypothetical protein
MEGRVQVVRLAGDCGREGGEGRERGGGVCNGHIFFFSAFFFPLMFFSLSFFITALH